MPNAHGSCSAGDRQLAIIAATDLPHADFVRTTAALVAVAIDENIVATLLGESVDGPVVCWRMCCADTPGAVVVVPDVLVAVLAEDGAVPPPTLVVQRADGRFAWVFAGSDGAVPGR